MSQAEQECSAFMSTEKKEKKVGGMIIKSDDSQ
jgi:hypothetical protein